MTAGDIELVSVNLDMAIAEELLNVGRDLQNLITDRSQPSREVDTGFVKVYGEVVSAVGQLFKNDAAGQKIKDLLDYLRSYSTLMNHFLITKSILDKVERVKTIDSKEHKDRLEWIIKQLARISIESTAIAQKIETLGKSIIDIICSEGSAKAAKLRIFDLRYNMASLDLESCMSGLGQVKRNIDEGLSSIEGYKKLITTKADKGFFAKVASILKAAILAIKNFITCKGKCPTNAPGNELSKANEIQGCYHDNLSNWAVLDDKLKTMKESLILFRENRREEYAKPQKQIRDTVQCI